MIIGICIGAALLVLMMIAACILDTAPRSQGTVTEIRRIETVCIHCRRARNFTRKVPYR